MYRDELKAAFANLESYRTELNKAVKRMKELEQQLQESETKRKKPVSDRLSAVLLRLTSSYLLVIVIGICLCFAFFGMFCESQRADTRSKTCQNFCNKKGMESIKYVKSKSEFFCHCQVVFKTKDPLHDQK